MRLNTNQQFTFLFIILFSFLLSACGGGGGGGSQTSTQQGVFLDAIVQGVSYTSGSISGTTDANGTFTYEPGKNITFKIGNIVLGTAAAAPIITPISLTGASSENDKRVINMVRFLLTLDDDGNPDNGIQITDAIRAAAAGQTVNFNVLPSAFDSGVQATLAVVIASSRPLVSESEAKTHFDSTIVGMRKSLAGNYSGTFGGGNSGTWQITVDQSGNITGGGQSNTTGNFTVSGNIDSSGRGAFGAAGLADFSGFFGLNGCFAGSWVDSSTSTSGTFSGTKTGSNASNCSAITAVTPSNGNTGGGSPGTTSNLITLSGPGTQYLGTSFIPTFDFSNGFNPTVQVILEDAAQQRELRVYYDKQSGTVVDITFEEGGGAGYSLLCIGGADCSGVNVDTVNRIITLTNVTMPPSPASTIKTGNITLNGSVSYKLP